MAQCTADSKQTGQRCKRAATPGWDVCHSHGSGTPRGIASPNLKHGRYSPYLPNRLLDRLEEGIKDPELLNMRQDIALLGARTTELLQRVDQGESGRLWTALRDKAKDVRKARNLPGKEGAATFKAEVLELLGIIDQGHADWAAWNDIVALIGKRERIIASERKREVEMQQLVSVHDINDIVRGFSEAVVEYVHDPVVLAAIQARVTRLLGRASH
jgi:hypothetical protein